jgi:preprotein translocase subunit SecA
MSFLTKLFGSDTDRAVVGFAPIVAQINGFEDELKSLSDVGLRAKTSEFKDRLLKGELLDDILPEAFATVREAARRTLGQRHFDVQLMGGITLHQGKIAEMKTGEGKTLVATLPAYLNALSGKGVHVVTVNDYLSRRDAVWMGQVYSLLGLTVGVLNHEESFLYDPNRRDLDEVRDQVGSFKVVHEFLDPCTRKEAYQADITYGTNNEYGFDYLRDNIEYDQISIRQREYNFAIVDEIDSILIDEARTPLIISAAVGDSEDYYHTFASLAQTMKRDTDFEVDEKRKQITITEEGVDKAEKSLGVDNIYTEMGVKYVHHLETAIRAKAIFERDKDYIVRDNEVVIVDEFTGRLQPGRRWSEGLHQAIEAKEGVKVQKESRTYASITFQNYFRMYTKLAGMTGTAVTSAEEFFKVYQLQTIVIPTNREVARLDHNDLIYQSELGKFKAVTNRIKELQQKGQPVLVGTASIEKNEVLSTFFLQAGITHEVLNAKNHEREGEIISEAGKVGRVTVATNLAGRGVDIKLGGSQATVDEAEKVKSLGGLFVLGTERHEARRIDNQLRGRSGRQGDPGETQFFVSLEDTLMRVFASDSIKNLMGRFGIPEDQPIENSLISRSLETAQSKIEGFNFDARKHVLEYDDVLNHQRKIIYERRRKILLGAVEVVSVLLEEVLEGNVELSEMVEQKKISLGNQEFYNVIRRLFLQSIDMFWVEHLEQMDYMRDTVNLRAYGQRDPLVEYKREGLQLFKNMQDAINSQISESIPNIAINAFHDEEAEMRRAAQEAQLVGGSDTTGEEVVSTPVMATHMSIDGEKISRNDLCPCGSGNKYKNCGLKNTEEHQELMVQKGA